MTKVVKDFSIQKQNANFSGVVMRMNASTSSFMLRAKECGDITIHHSSQTIIKKGNSAASFTVHSVPVT